MPLSHDDISIAYERYNELLRRFCRSRLCDPHAADDVVSLVWEEVVKKAAHYEDRGFEIKAWLLKIAHSRCIDQYRRGVRQQTQRILERDSTVDDFDTCAEITVVAQSALNACTHHERELLILRFFYGFEQKEIAQHWRVTLGEIKALERRALGRARRSLGIL